MKSLALAVVLAACSGSTAHSTNPAAPLPAANTTCYAGMSNGMGQSARTIARRSVNPAAGTITEDVTHDEGGAHGAKSFHVLMQVEGDHFTMTETGDAFRGSGTLVGEPWQWTAWSSTSEIPNTGITVASDDEITPIGMTATKQIKRNGQVVATTKEELKTFDCAEWDKAVAALAQPPLASGGCERACKNFAQLKYWARADVEISALPVGEQAAVRAQKRSELQTEIEAGLPACVATCIESNNSTQTACIAGAASIRDLGACE
ncbi:hypothetical protein BH11MYX3_BH11MYX3_42150 [soil metagenome]